MAKETLDQWYERVHRPKVEEAVAAADARIEAKHAATRAAISREAAAGDPYARSAVVFKSSLQRLTELRGPQHDSAMRTLRRAMALNTRLGDRKVASAKRAAGITS